MAANAGDVSLSVTLALGDLIRDAKRKESEIQKAIGDINVKVNLSVDTGDMGKAGRDAGDSFGNAFNRALDGVFQGVGQQITQLTVQALQSAAGAIADLGQQGLGASDKLNSSIAAVNSLGADGKSTADALGNLSEKLGGLASKNELTAAAYDVLSSKTETLTAGLTDAEVATNILEAATKGAIGGFSKTETVADALTSVLNSYRLSATEAESITAKIIATQNAGKITAGEYAAQIGRLAPTAAQAGVGIDELNGFIATATAQGVPVESTFAGIRQSISAILKPSDQATELAKKLGVEFNSSALKTKGLSGVLADLNAVGGDSADNLTKLFGSVEAVAAIAPSAGQNIATLNSNIDRSAKALQAGELDTALNAVASTAEKNFGNALNLLNNKLIELGDALAPVRNEFLELGAAIINAVGKSTAIEDITAASERFTETVEKNPQLLEAIADAAVQVANSLGQITAAAIDALGSFADAPQATAGVRALADQVQTLGNIISTVVSNIRYFAQLLKQTNSTAGFVIDLITVLSQVSDLLSGIFQKIEDVAGGLKNSLGGVIDGLTKRLKGFVDLLGKIPGIGNLIPKEATTDEAFKQRQGFAEADRKSAAKGVTDQAFNENLLRNRRPAPPKEATPEEKKSIDEQLAELENSNKLKEAALIASGKSEEEIRKQQLANEKAFLEQRIDLNTQKTLELTEAVKNAEDPKEREKLQNELAQTEARIIDDRLAVARNGAAERERIEKESLKAIEDAVKKSAAAIEQSQNAAELAVRQRQKDGVISEEQAAVEIAKIQDRSTTATIAAKQKELADIRSARASGTIDAEEAAERERDLITQIGDLRLEQINSQIQAQKAAEEAAKAAQMKELERGRAIATAQGEAALAAVDARNTALQRQNDLYQAQLGLQGAIANYQNQQLETAITSAESEGRTADATRLRLQLLQQQQAQLAAQQEAEAKSLVLQQQAEDLAARREEIQARIAANEAEIALATARANGETEEQIRLAEQRLALARENVAIAQQGAAANETRQSIDRARQFVEQRTAQEQLRGRQIQDVEALGQQGGFSREITAYLNQLRSTSPAPIQGGLDLRSLQAPAIVNPQLATPNIQPARIPPNLNLPELSGLAEEVRQIRQFLPQLNTEQTNNFVLNGLENGEQAAQIIARKQQQARARLQGR